MSFGSASDQANGTFCKWACQTIYNDYGQKPTKEGTKKPTVTAQIVSFFQGLKQTLKGF
jgi:hypothetical protein